MIMWGAGNTAANTPKWSSMYITAGSGFANRASNNTSMFQNSSAETFGKNGHTPFQASGIFALTPAQRANTSGEGAKTTQTGWNLREAGEGPVIAASVVAPFSTTTANGETVTFSNGSANGIGTLTTNTNGNAVSISFPVGAAGGRFVNSSIVAFSFNREKHITAVSVTSNAGSTGWTNGDILLVANGIIAAPTVVTTTVSGNLSSLAVNAAANGGFGSGLYPNTYVSANLSFIPGTVANQSATIGSATFTATLANSAGGNLTSIACGGRAGRVMYECLVAMTPTAVNNNSILPS